MKSATILTVVLAAMTASAVNKTWVGGAEGAWAEAANWDPSGVPGTTDVLIFDSTDPITVILGAEQSFNGFTVANTPCLTFKGLESGSLIQARQDIKSGLTAPVVFDENTHVKFYAGKVWWTEAEVKLLGGVSATKGNTPTLGMISGSQGCYVVRGPVDFPNSVTLSAPIDWKPSSVAEGTSYNVASCDLRYNFAPTIEGTLLRFTGGSGGLGGTAPLTVKSPDPTRPGAVVKQFANPSIYLARSMPTIFAEWFSLCESKEKFNNAKVGFVLDSAAELRFQGKISGNNAASGVQDGTSDYGFRLGFRGCGSNVRIEQSNDFEGRDGNSMSVIPANNGVGYNSIEFDGEGQEIHPFGVGNVYANDGHGVFFKPLSAGKTLTNGFSYGNSVNNGGYSYTFGFDGSNDLTVSGPFKLGTAYSKLPVLGTMTLTLTGEINPAAAYLNVTGPGNVVLAPSSRVTGTTGRIGKNGSGTMTLQGSFQGESYNKGWFCGGKTVFDYTVNEGSRLNTAKSGTALADALTLRGTELVLKGGAVAETVGEGNGTTFQNGLTKICREGGSSTIYLGKLASAPTGAQGTAAAVVYEDGISRVDASQANALLNGHHQVGDHFAKTDAEGVITAAADDESANTTKITGSQSSGRLVNSLFVIEPVEAGQSVTLTSATAPMVANWNGMIFRGPHDFTVTGGQFGGSGTSNSALVFNHCGTGVFTIDSELYRTGFTKIGPGTVRLTGKSTLSQSLNIYEGTFEAASATAFSDASKTSYNVYLNGGMLKTSVDVSLVRPMSVGDNGGVINVTEGTTFTQTAAIETTADGVSGPIVKEGKGTWAPGGQMTAQAEVRLTEGTIRLGAANALGDSETQMRSISPTTLTGGVLDVAGFAAHLGNVYLKGGTISDSSQEKTGSLGAYTFFAEEGTVNVPLTDVRNPNNNRNAPRYFVANNLKKIGSGTVTLTAANTFQGTAYVEDGTLDLTGSLASGACVEGGVLTGTGSIDGYVYVTADGALAPKAGAVMTLGDHLAIGEGGTLRLAANESGVSKVALATGNVYLGKDARLEFDLSQGGIAKLNGSVLVDLPEGAKVEGTFANFVNGKYTDAAGNKYTISYTAGDGNDIAVVGRGRGFSLVVR